MLNEVLIKVLFEMLIEVLIDDLIEFVRAAFDVDTSNALAGFSMFCQNAAFNVEAVGCTDEFADLSERLHLTMRRSGALANFR